MNRIEIQDKQIFDTFGEIKTTATSVEVNINYEIGQSFANGNAILFDDNEKICASFNKQVSTEGWGDNDNVIIDRFLDLIKVKKK